MSILLKASELKTPMAASELFTRTGPLVFEVGFGDGRYLEHLQVLIPTGIWSGLRSRWGQCGARTAE